MLWSCAELKTSPPIRKVSGSLPTWLSRKARLTTTIVNSSPAVIRAPGVIDFSRSVI